MRFINFHCGKYLFLILIFINQYAFANNPQDDFDKEYLELELLRYDEKYDEFFKKANELLAKNTDNTLIIVKIYNVISYKYSFEKDFKNSLKYISKAKKIADSTQDLLDDAYVLEAYMKLYYFSESFEEVLHNGNKVVKILDDYPNEYYLSSTVYNIIAATNLISGVLSKDMENNLLKSLDFAQKSKIPYAELQAYTSLTMFYATKYTKTNEKKYLDELFRIVDITTKYLDYDKKQIPEKLKLLIYINKSNIISQYPYKSLSAQERYNLALMLMNEALSLSKYFNKFYTKAVIHSSLGDLHSLNKRNDLAKINYLKAFDYLKKDPLDKNYTINIINKLTSIFEEEKNFVEAYKFSKESNEVLKKVYEIENSNKKNFYESIFSTEQKIKQIKQLEEKNKLYTKINYLLGFLIFISILGLSFLVYMIRYRQKVNKQKTQLLEAEMHEKELTLQLEKEEKARLKAEQELLALQQEKLQKTALATSLKLDKKNSLINELKSKVEPDTKIKMLLKEDKLSDEDFNEIENVIQEVHPNFFKRLNELAVKKLTNLDLRYSAYIYLNMNNQQIANILNVDIKTVRMSKYRLKQKFGLDKEVDLKTFIQNINMH